MSNATDYLETAVANALFFNSPLAVSAWTVHLFSTMPNDAGLNGVEIIAGANGYQPVNHNPGVTNWIKDETQSVSGSTVVRNNAPVQFPIAVVAWPPVVGFGLKNETGQFCYIANLSTVKNVAAGDAPVFLVGELEFQIG